MRAIALALLLCLVLYLPAVAEDYINPLRVYNDAGQVMDAADPFVMRHNGRYYLYTTGDSEIRCYSSQDLVSWTYEGYCTANRDGEIAYAPEVFYWRGAFYMITSPRGNGHYILRSESPTGIFEKVTGNFGHSIDGALFTTDDGRLWMLCLENSAISITEIDQESLTPVGVKYKTGASLSHWTEGPGLIRRGDYYFLTYTGNHYLSTGYRVAWASRKADPLGRFTFAPDNTLLINSVYKDDFTGLGHSANFYGPDLDSIYTSYHAHAPKDGSTAAGSYVFARWYCLDRLLTNGGYMYTTGASNTPMPVPAMPDVYGDVQGDLNDWTLTDEGVFATVPAAARFTQECNFILEGGVMAWRLGSHDGQPVLLMTDGANIDLMIGDTAVAGAPVPELGEAGRLHTLRVECTEDVLYAYIDGMRLLTVTEPGVVADTIGALTREGVRYSFLAHTASALGDSDKAAVKAIPGSFAAVHAVSADAETIVTGTLEQQALVLGNAEYNVRVAEDGLYAFDLTVRAADTGKQLALTLDGQPLLTATIPACPEKKAEWFTFTTEVAGLPAGDHVLTISGDGAALLQAEAFRWAQMQSRTWDLANKQRDGIITLGNFMAKDGGLAISANKSGFALIGDEGCTDYEMRVRFEIPVKGTGTAGFLMHATDVSLYDAQVAESAFGYAISVTKLGVNAKLFNYGGTSRTEFATVKAWSQATEAELILRVEGGKLTVWLPESDEPLMTMHHAQPYSHGMCGLYSTGKELKVTALTVTALEE